MDERVTEQYFKSKILEMIEKINDKEVLRKVYTIVRVWSERD